MVSKSGISWVNRQLPVSSTYSPSLIRQETSPINLHVRFATLLAWVVVIATSSGCAESKPRASITNIRTSTSMERITTLSALQSVWENRPTELSEANFWYERRLIARSAYFGKKVQGTECFDQACSFWSGCVHAHISRYGTDIYKAH